MTDETREQIEQDGRKYAVNNYGNPDHLDRAEGAKSGYVAGATHQHPIAFTAGRNQAIEEVIKCIREYPIDDHGWIEGRSSTIIEELEALKTKV